MFKKLLVSVLIGITFLFSSAPFLQAKAQTSWYNQTFPEWYLKVYDSTNPNEIFGERYTAAQVQWIVYSLPSLLINLALNGNTDLGSCLMGAASNSINASNCINGVNGIVDDLITKLRLPSISNAPSVSSQILAERPISGISYGRNVISKLNPVTIAKAQSTQQGYGITVIKSVAFIWKMTRNISYFFFIVIAVVFAFMIMFRVKLSPQTVVSIQSSLPKLIVALILVTFSFAIAGLMIDLMYVIMGLFATFVAGAFSNTSGWGYLGANTVFAFINGTIFPLVNGGIALVIYFTIYLVLYVIALVMIIIAAALGFNISSLIFSLFLIIFGIILILVLLWYVFKVTYVLFKNLAEVYGLIIIAPLQITVGVLFPQAGFGSWLKKLFSKLMIFPLTGIFIYIAMMLLGYSIRFSAVGIVQDNIFTVIWTGAVTALGSVGLNVKDLVVTGEWAPPMLGGAASSTGIAFLLMSVGLIMMIPKIGESIESFMAGKGIAGTAIGEAMGPLGGLAKTAGGMATGAGTEQLAGGASKALNQYIVNLSRNGKLKDGKIKDALETLSSFMGSLKSNRH